MAAVWQEGRVPPGRTRQDIQFQRQRLSTARRDPVEAIQRTGHEHNHVVVVPRATAWLPCRSEGLNSPRSDMDNFELSVRKETDPRSVGRPEREQGAVSVGDWPGTVMRVERLQIQELPA